MYSFPPPAFSLTEILECEHWGQTTFNGEAPGAIARASKGERCKIEPIGIIQRLSVINDIPKIAIVANQRNIGRSWGQTINRVTRTTTRTSAFRHKKTSLFTLSRRRLRGGGRANKRNRLITVSRFETPKLSPGEIMISEWRFI